MSTNSVGRTDNDDDDSEVQILQEVSFEDCINAKFAAADVIDLTHDSEEENDNTLDNELANKNQKHGSFVPYTRLAFKQFFKLVGGGPDEPTQEQSSTKEHALTWRVPYSDGDQEDLTADDLETWVEATTLLAQDEGHSGENNGNDGFVLGVLPSDFQRLYGLEETDWTAEVGIYGVPLWQQQKGRQTDRCLVLNAYNSVCSAKVFLTSPAISIIKAGTLFLRAIYGKIEISYPLPLNDSMVVTTVREEHVTALCSIGRKALDAAKTLHNHNVLEDLKLGRDENFRIVLAQDGTNDSLDLLGEVVLEAGRAFFVEYKAFFDQQFERLDVGKARVVALNHAKSRIYPHTASVGVVKVNRKVEEARGAAVENAEKGWLSQSI